MLNLDGIKLVSGVEAKAIIKNRVPLGTFLEIPEDGPYVAIDNTSGDAWIEDYDSLTDAILYLNVNAHEELTKLPKWYFTYGSDSPIQPFKGGWSIVFALNEKLAVKKFLEWHPAVNGLVPCSDWYSEKMFMRTDMFHQHHNYGAGCHEVIR